MRSTAERILPAQRPQGPREGVPTADEGWRREIITQSPAMEAVLTRAQRVAQTDAPVCIVGASGTGKEVLARAIHRASRRASARFVALNCGAIPEGLLESELFGHRKGAFTGAVQDRRGLFQAAEHGTLFLDEIGDMPLALQVKLLRALEERVVRPVGASDEVAIDVRIMSATHRKLEERVASGAFREDLYYRLNVVKLALPTLQERREDIPPLVRHALARFAAQYERGTISITEDAMDLLTAAPWPGNIRQLINAIEHVIALSSPEGITRELVSQALGGVEPTYRRLDEARMAFEHDYLVQALKMTSGNVTRAARLVGRNRTEFYRLLERHGLAPRMFKPQSAEQAKPDALPASPAVR